MSATRPRIYPESRSARDRWILERRPSRNAVDARKPYAFFVEPEHSSAGEIVPVATILLTNRECPWHCLMCDLWKNTLTENVEAGAIPAQIDYALKEMPAARQIKLYNSGSFFDPRAIPLVDYAQIASQADSFERVIVESHPALVGDTCFQFQALLTGRLEVAMGLETAHPQILDRLNKQMTLDSFRAAADRLCTRGVDLRVFILVKPPFMKEDETLLWAARSLDFAFDCGATAATLIPTRAGNGALDQLALTGEFAPPRISTVEAALDYGLSCGRGRVFVDLWDLAESAACPHCHELRINRLRSMNLQQLILRPVACPACGAGS